MTKFRSMGIDPSVSSTGIVVLEESGKAPTLVLEKCIAKPKVKGMLRLREIVTEIMETIHTHNPDRIVIEGYSLNLKNKASVIPLVELGGLLRFMMYLDGLAWYAPRAPEVKKFLTGSSNSKKEVMMMHVLKRWGHESMNNDTADAYVLAAMGLAHANRLQGLNQAMRNVIGNMTKETN